MYLEISYDVQKVAAQGKLAVMALMNPLYLFTFKAFFEKSMSFEEACRRVLIESMGKRAKSTDIPATPPARAVPDY